MPSKFFSDDELKCKCCGKIDMDQSFLNRLDLLRQAFGGPLIITSGYRCKPYNEKIKGSKNSQHCLGRAVDIACAEGDKRHKLVSAAMYLGFSGVGLDGAFCHVDTRLDPPKVLWMYPQHGE